MLRELTGGTGIPRLHWCGTVDGYVVQALDSYGPTVEVLFNQAGRRFNLKTVLLLAEQLISRLELIHSRSIVHGNLVPDTLALSSSSWQRHQVFLTGFEDAQKCNSISSSRIDLQNQGRLLIYLCGSEVSWSEFRGMKHEEYRSHQIPGAFFIYEDHVMSNKTPDYSQLRQIFRDLHQQLELSDDHFLDIPYKTGSGVCTRLDMETLGNTLYENLLTIGSLFKKVADENLGVGILHSLSDALELYTDILYDGFAEIFNECDALSPLWEGLWWYLATEDRPTAIRKAVVNILYGFMAALMETIPSHQAQWLGRLVSLAREEGKMADRTEKHIWEDVIQQWEAQLYGLGMNLSTTGFPIPLGIASTDVK